MNELQTVEKTSTPAEIDFKSKASEYLQSMGTKLPQRHMAQFLELAQSYQLNPFKREIYAVGYGDNWNIITGFEVYLKRAERSGLLDGWETEETGRVEDGSLKSTITIYRKDRAKPFRHTVYYVEAVNKTKDGKPNSVWAKMPFYMTKKVAMAQGFRLCFPDELAGMPYTSDEISAPEIVAEQPSAAARPQTNNAKSKKADAPKDDPYKMNSTQIQLMKQMFSEDVFTEEEKQIYRDLLQSHSRTAYEIIEDVTTVYAERQSSMNADADMVSAAFDGGNNE